VTSFGVFVQLDDVFIEGLVHVTSLENDYYELDTAKHQLVGARTGKTYQLAAPLRVRVVAVDMEQRRIDFEPVEPKRRSRGRRRKQSAGKPASGHRDVEPRPSRRRRQARE
jgi:ribonuclease R